MIDCAKISKNIAGFNCTAGPVGIMPEVILLNFDDIKEVEEASGVVESITLNTGKYGYKWEGAKDSFEGNAALQAGTYRNRFIHSLVLRLFDKTQDIKGEIDKIANAKVVAIVKNVNKKVPGVVYEVYGLENGLNVTDLQSASTDTDGVFYTVTLASSDRGAESGLPKSFYDTDLSTTEAAIAALLPSTSSQQ